MRHYEDFSKQFAQSGGGPIDYKGRRLYAAHWIDVAKRDEIIVTIVRHNKNGPKQGLCVACRGKNTRAEINGRAATRFLLWAHTAPPEITISVIRAGPGGQIGLFNVWEDEKFGTVLYGLGCSAMCIGHDESGVLLSCSDSSCPPDFEDLVVRVVKRDAR